MGTGIKSNTTEVQLVELEDGSLILNCRDKHGGAWTVGVTKDMGATWECFTRGADSFTFCDF